MSGRLTKKEEETQVTLQPSTSSVKIPNYETHIIKSSNNENIKNPDRDIYLVQYAIDEKGITLKAVHANIHRLLEYRNLMRVAFELNENFESVLRLSERINSSQETRYVILMERLPENMDEGIEYDLRGTLLKVRQRIKENMINGGEYKLEESGDVKRIEKGDVIKQNSSKPIKEILLGRLFKKSANAPPGPSFLVRKNGGEYELQDSGDVIRKNSSERIEKNLFFCKLFKKSANAPPGPSRLIKY